MPLGTGCYLSFSRGALAALAAGLVAVVLLAPTRLQLRAAATALAAGALGAAAAGLSPAVRALVGSPATREREGAIVLAITVVLMLLPPPPRTARLRPPAAPDPSLRVAGVRVILALFVRRSSRRAAGSRRRPRPGATNARFSTLGSNRYGYWRIALRAGELTRWRASAPAASASPGCASGRTTSSSATRTRSSSRRSPSSGSSACWLLGGLLGGVATAARAAHRVDPALAAGPAAALVVWGCTPPSTGTGRCPALTLVALVLAGALLARARPAEGPAQLGEQRPLAVHREAGEHGAEEPASASACPERPPTAPER